MATFRAIVLAGERPGGGVLARELGLAAGVLAPLAGQPCIVRVVACLRAARWVTGGTLCGPDPAVTATSAELQALLAGGDFHWLAPSSGPAASALAASRAEATTPLLLTSGDHGLLDAAMVDGFCSDAWRAGAASGADLLVGLVPHQRVAAAFPDSKRTVLRFSDGAFCGSNLFALLTPQSQHALTFWSALEAYRKQPWKIARQLGATTVLRYLSRRLSVDEAFRVLSRHAGCRVGWIPVNAARAAVDVDSRADWLLADRLLREDAAASPAAAIEPSHTP
ncbi:MAG: MobA-like NTP transferase domain containing protein [Pseudomonadales bacterium]